MSPDTATPREFDALLLDIGDVITASVFDQLDDLEAASGRTIPGRGPLDPERDPLWQEYLRGRLGFVGYWKALATKAGYSDWKLLFRDVVEHLPHRFADEAALSLMNDAKAAGLKVAVLTNDGVGIAGRDFFATRPELAMLDAFVDARELGTAKPDPEPYLRAASILGLAPERIIFLDDTPECVDGARNVGMTAVLVDPLHKDPAFATTRALLGLVPPTPPRALARRMDAAMVAGELDAVMSLFDADVILHWNGSKLASGTDACRSVIADRLGLGAESTAAERLTSSTRTFRAAEGDTVALEWSVVTSAGRSFTAAELWSMRGHRVIDWRIVIAETGS